MDHAAGKRGEERGVPSLNIRLLGGFEALDPALVERPLAALETAGLPAE